MSILFRGDKVDVEIDGTPGHYAPANFSGHPDNWHPDESEAPELISVCLVETGEEILQDLSMSEIHAIEARLMDNRNDYDLCDEPDYDDIDDDSWMSGQDAWEDSQGI